MKRNKDFPSALCYDWIVYKDLFPAAFRTDGAHLKKGWYLP